MIVNSVTSYDYVCKVVFVIEPNEICLCLIWDDTRKSYLFSTGIRILACLFLSCSYPFESLFIFFWLKYIHISVYFFHSNIWISVCLSSFVVCLSHAVVQSYSDFGALTFICSDIYIYIYTDFSFLHFFVHENSDIVQLSLVSVMSKYYNRISVC